MSKLSITRKFVMTSGRWSVLALLLAFGFSNLAFAAPPDLTTGGVPDDTLTINLGPTGARGWVYHVKENTTESRQIQVKVVDAGSPAAGILAVNDVILGADGSGVTPTNFSSDARKALAAAIRDAEARNPATLKLLRWRAGTTTEVTLTLRTMGAYSATAPYNCPKSAKILAEGLQLIMAGETKGKYSFGTLSLLAANNPSDPNNAARMARAETEALALIPSAATMTQLMADERDAGSQVTWSRGHTLIVLAEYYLATGDTRVLPAVEAYAVNIARNQSLFGTVGHIYAEKNLDGSDNGPMGGFYGPVNSTGMPCFLGLLLARECGLTHPGFQPSTEARVEAAIERTSRFFAYYAGRGAIPYGEHEPFATAHENNGKSGLAAICFGLQDNRAEEGKFYAKMAAASAYQRAEGHTGAFFNYLWAPLGAAAGGEEAAASHFSRISWMLDLNRRWNGGFDYDCLNGEGPNSGSQWYDFRMSTAALLVYALPLRQLHITGRVQKSTHLLTSIDVAEAAVTDGYDATIRGTNELIADLGSWSPMVQRRSAEQLATRTIDTATLAQITSLATDPAGSSRVGACYALGKITNSSTANARAATLAGLLTDPQNHVRFMAAEAMRYLPQTAKMSQLDAILSATASTAAPLFPLNEEDPLHFAHGRLAMLLFYGGNAYGPKGVIWGTGINGLNRTLLYPAISAVAANPVGLNRSTLYHTYINLTAADVDALADTLVDSIHYRAPSDKMFSAGIRQSGIVALEKYNIAEGVPLAIAFMEEDGRSSTYTDALGVLKDYAGGSTTVTPDPDVSGFCRALLSGAQAAAAQAVLDAIAADPTPAPLTSYKSVQSVTVNATSLTLPANQTVLHASATDLAEGDLVYTWRKVHGAGSVSFSPNGTAAAKDSNVLLSNVPGQYRFEVTVSDSRGFTEVSDSVSVTLYDSGGNLPSNNPPVANPQSVTAAPASSTPITLTGSDPEAYPLVFIVTSQPTYGNLSGTAPDVFYTPNNNYIGPDNFTFEVMDSEGQVSSATVSIDVNTTGIELYVYEPFDYATGPLAGKAGGTGMSGAWADGPETTGTAAIHDESSGTTPLNTNVGTLSWDGVVNNLPTLPATGARYVGVGTGDKWECYRSLAQDAGTMAGADKVLWASMAWHNQGGGFGHHVGLALATDSFTDMGKKLRTSGSFGSNAGDGIGVAESAVNTQRYSASVFDGGLQVATTTSGSLTKGDMVLVLKFEFGAIDKVSVFAFSEDATLSEQTFNTNKITASAAVDESTLNILTFSNTRGEPAFDEIRIGNSFAAVIGVEGPPADTTPPTLAATDIVDNRSGEPVTQNTPVSYAVTFSEEMDTATVNASDFSNAGSSAITVDSIIHPTPGVFVVQVTPLTSGSLKLQVKVGATLSDLAGNPLNTALAIADDTEITVNSLLVIVPDVVGLPQVTAEANIISAGLVVGAVTSQYHASIPIGQIISQGLPAGSGVSTGSSVSLVVSLGPGNGGVFTIADIPVSGTVLGGTHSDTHASDNVYQVLREELTKGNPNKRLNFLEHKWLFEVAAGDTVTFYVEAFHSSNTENDHFSFAYSTTGASGAYQPMLTVIKTSDDNTEQTYILPAGISGTVHVRVVDTDRTQGKSNLDTISIDRMYFKSVSAPPLTDVEIWRSQYPSADLNDLATDLDGDGMSNGDERLWGLDPTSAASANPISSPMNPTTGIFSYTRRDPNLTGATYSIWTSANLTGWSLDSGASQVAGTPDSNDIETVTVTLSPELLSAPHLFMQVHVAE